MVKTFDSKVYIYLFKPIILKKPLQLANFTDIIATTTESVLQPSVLQGM